MTARSVLLIVGYGALVVGGVIAGPWLAGLLEYDVRPSNEPQVHRMLLLATAMYVLAAALPFVPGAEIGLAMMVMMGSGIVALVYVSRSSRSRWPSSSAGSFRHMSRRRVSASWA